MSVCDFMFILLMKWGVVSQKKNIFDFSHLSNDSIFSSISVNNLQKVFSSYLFAF